MTILIVGGVMTKKEKQQWDIIEKAKELLIEWSNKNNARIFTIHFVPMYDFSLEVYVFYEKDADISENQKNGVSENVKQIFIKTISSMGYMEKFGDKISFEFDSNENVINNYNGSYFLRLR
jgi:hypothetical protein